MTKVWDILDPCGGNKGGWFITTTSDLDTTRCQSIMATSLLVMSATIATPPFKLIELSMMQPWRVANALAPEPSEAVEPLASELLSSDAVGDDSHVGTATFEQTGDPLLLIGRASGQRSQGDPADALYRSPFQ